MSLIHPSIHPSTPALVIHCSGLTPKHQASRFTPHVTRVSRLSVFSLSQSSADHLAPTTAVFSDQLTSWTAAAALCYRAEPFSVKIQSPLYSMKCRCRTRNPTVRYRIRHPLGTPCLPGTIHRQHNPLYFLPFRPAACQSIPVW